MKGINDTILYDYPQNYWDFKGATKEGIHLVGKYPATMVADMQYELVNIIAKKINEQLLLLDPFCGSGTSLVVSESMGIPSIGIDLNPYAVLLSSVKVRKYDREALNNSIISIFKKLDTYIEYENHYFNNIEKWFRQDIINTLSKIKTCIEKEKDKEIREFFWVCFSEVVFQFSNDRTSTFKLHALPEEKIKLIKNKCIEEFKNVLIKNGKVLNFSNSTSSKVIQGDSKDIMKTLPDESISIICTSPPYGDNATTVTYGQFSILALKWINENDVLGDKILLENYSKIDRLSLGGTKRVRNYTASIHSLQKYLTNISEKKQQKIINFFEDYYNVFVEMIRVLKLGGYLLMTVGNRTVDGFIQPLDKISIEIAENLGLEIVTEFDRKILSKNMPSRISNVNGIGSVNSMMKESVLIFKKKK